MRVHCFEIVDRVKDSLRLVLQLARLL
jgi:hypothetical protein